jgi:ribosomal protein S4
MISVNKITDTLLLDYSATLLFSKISKIFFALYKSRKKVDDFRRRRYIYRIDDYEEQSSRKQRDERFISLRIARLYFFMMQDHQFRRLFRQAARLDGNLESNYCYLLEGRLSSTVYRSQLLTNPFEILKFIKTDNISIDSNIMNKPYVLVTIGKFLVFNIYI